MARHKIVMRAPERELTRADVEFEVHIDGVKRGELHLSQCDLTWWPRNTRRSSISVTWDQFAEWMESEASENED